MTLNQLDSLTDDEIAIAMVAVNDICPMTFPKIQFTNPRQLTWFKHDALVKKLLDAFPRLSPEGHATYSSLLHKLGVQHEIKYEQPAPPPPVAETSATGSAEISPETQVPTPEVVAPQVEAPITGSSETSAEMTGSSEITGSI
jgi:hypothetical protein